MKHEWTYPSKVIKVVDADTLRLELDFGFYTKSEQNFRLARINAPEIRGEERPEGLISKDFVIQLLNECNNECRILSKKHGKYRWVVEVYLDTTKDGSFGTNLSDLLVEKNLAVYKEY